MDIRARKRNMVTDSLVRDANRAAIEGRDYAPHIKVIVERLPRLTAEDINNVWAKVNGGRTKKRPI